MEREGSAIEIFSSPCQLFWINDATNAITMKARKMMVAFREGDWNIRPMMLVGFRLTALLRRFIDFKLRMRVRLRNHCTYMSA